MLDVILAIVYVAAFIVTCVSLFLTIAHLFGALQNIKPEKRFVASLLSPMTLLMPSMFSKEGNWHRLSFAPYLLLALVMMGLLAMLENYFSK